MSLFFRSCSSLLVASLSCVQGERWPATRKASEQVKEPFAVGDVTACGVLVQQLMQAQHAAAAAEQR